MTSRPRLSREYFYVASDEPANAETGRAVTRKIAERGEGRLISGPRLLIRKSRDRVPELPPACTRNLVAPGCVECRALPHFARGCAPHFGVPDSPFRRY